MPGRFDLFFLGAGTRAGKHDYERRQRYELGVIFTAGVYVEASGIRRDTTSSLPKGK